MIFYFLSNGKRTLQVRIERKRIFPFYWFKHLKKNFRNERFLIFLNRLSTPLVSYPSFFYKKVNVLIRCLSKKSNKFYATYFHFIWVSNVWQIYFTFSGTLNLWICISDLCIAKLLQQNLNFVFRVKSVFSKKEKKIFLCTLNKMQIQYLNLLWN